MTRPRNKVLWESPVRREVRAVLQANPDGMIMSEIAPLIDRPYASIYHALHEMVGSYIDRWYQPGPGRAYKAVWCVADIPEDCPRPDRNHRHGRKKIKRA